jgi:protein-tyrosine phosphatase
MENIINFRDLGGYKTRTGFLVKKGLIFRSGSLDKASARDLKELSSLGIRTVCDLRTEKESSTHPDRIPATSEVKIVHLPIDELVHRENGAIAQLLSFRFGKARGLDFSELSKQGYRKYITNSCAEFAGIFRLIVERRNLPVLIHCTAGKDRTGLACSLILQTLGVPFEAVMQEYLITNDYLHEFTAHMLNRLKFVMLFGLSRRRFLPLFDARSEYLLAAFDQMDRTYGSVEGYLRAGLGLSDKDRWSLIGLFLEKDGQR